jgi:hypothetical protein
MAAPLLALPALGKLGAALKGLFAAKKIAGATQLAIPGLTAAGKTAAATGAKTGLLGNAKRMAGQVMTEYLGGPATPRNLAMNFGLDGAFGVMAGMQEPGDLGDKLIRGLTVAGAGGIGGIGATVGVGKLTGRMPDGLLRQATEVGGALLGDQVGYSMADGVQRAKNGGMTAWEKESLRQQMEDMYASGRGDQFLYQNGLG